MNPMKASFNPRLHQAHPDIRTDFRYRLAKLLLLEQFDEALREAEIALSRQDILPEDLRFVRDIVEDAKKQGPFWQPSVNKLNGTHRYDTTSNSNHNDNSR
jgi:hypothetical protein